jgi:hypothetical protein
VLLFVMLIASAPMHAAASPAAPASATSLASQVLEALGGRTAWQQTRYLRFDFAVERGGQPVMRRAHTWDKWTGRYRLEGRDREGHAFVVAMNLNTRVGQALVDGQPVTGEALKARLDGAYASWVNDTYWLLMPYKLEDPGVALTLDGQAKGDGQTWDKLLLTFDGVGLTPKDKYWAYVNRDTRLVDRWEFVLGGERKPPTRFDWTGWTRHGAILLAPERRDPVGGTRIHFPVLAVPPSLPDEAFALKAAPGAH